MSHTLFSKWGGCTPSSLLWRSCGFVSIQLRRKVSSFTDHSLPPCIFPNFSMQNCTCLAPNQWTHPAFPSIFCLSHNLNLFALKLLCEHAHTQQKHIFSFMHIPLLFCFLPFSSLPLDVHNIYTILNHLAFFCSRKRDIHSVWGCKILPLWGCACPVVNTSGGTYTFFAIKKHERRLQCSSQYMREFQPSIYNIYVLLFYTGVHVKRFLPQFFFFFGVL